LRLFDLSRAGAALVSALDLQPAASFKNLTKLLLRGNAFSTAGVVELMGALETNSASTLLSVALCSVIVEWQAVMPCCRFCSVVLLL
jgi:hypothetical protein